MHRRRVLAASLALPVLARSAAAQARVLRIVAPFTPGGGTDTTARVLAPAMGEFLGQAILVENRPGGSGSIGAASVAEAVPDGQTLMVDALNHAVNPHILKGLRFDYATAFTPVSQLTILPQILAVPPSLPVNTVAEFIAWARARPGQLSFGSSGNATGAHLAGVMFLQETGLDITHVPYRGGSAVLPDLIAGNVVFAWATVNSATGLVREGRLKALAVTSAQRVASLPEVPTVAEAGIPKLALNEWNILTAPAATPREALERVHAAVRHALAQPAVQQRFAQIGAITVGSPPEEAARFVAQQRETLGALVRAANITLE